MYVMRNRAFITLILIGFFILIVLAQSGSLNDVFSSLSLITPMPLFQTGQPVVTARPIIFSTAVPPGVTVYPTYYLPTSGFPVYVPTNPGQPGQAPQPAPIPAGGIVSPDGQCIVPNGWVQYVIQ